MAKPIPAGPKAQSLFWGHLKQLAPDWVGPLAADRERYGDVVPYRLGPRPYLAIHDPALVEEIFLKKPKSFLRSDSHRLAKPLQRDGLFMNDDYNSWLARRRMMAPSFHKSSLARYAEIITETIDEELKQWPENQPFDINPRMSQVALTVTARSLFGSRPTGGSELAQSLNALMAVFNERLDSLLPLPEWLPVPAIRRMRKAVKGFDKVIAEFIAEHRANKQSEPNDFLAMLLAARDESGAGLTDAQVRDEAVTLFFAGYETSGSSLAFALHQLAAHPELQERLRAEVAQLNGGVPTLSTLGQLKYLNAFISELLRLYPAAWGLSRMAGEDVEIGEYTIKKGWHVTVASWLIHRDERLWKNPLQFNPDRWLDGSTDNLPKAAYFPFGLGGRICLGAELAKTEIALVLARTLASRVVLPTSERPLEVSLGWTVRPKAPILLRAQRISSAQQLAG